MAFTEQMITLPARDNAPATEIYTKIYSKEGLGTRDMLIMLPGGPGNEHGTYDAPELSMAQALFPYVDILLFDPRACGRSQKSSAEYCSMAHYIDDVEAIRAHYMISKECFLVFGQSYGAIVAIGYAIKYHDRLKKLALFGGAVSGGFLKQLREYITQVGTPDQRRLAEKFWYGTFTGDEDENAEFFEVMGPLYSCTFKPGLPTPPLNYNVEVLNFGFGQFLKEFDYQAELHKISCPTLLLWGDEDHLFDLRQAEILHQNIPNNKFIMLKHCGHIFWADCWDGFLKEMVGFLYKS